MSLVLALGAAALAVTRLGVTTDIGGLFSASLPWKQREAALKRDYPQFNNLIVAVINARIPEEAAETAADLARVLARDTTHFRFVRQPDTSPYLDREGLLFLTGPQLAGLLDSTVDAQPFLGQLVADPSTRGLFSALALVGEGVARGQAQLGPFEAALGGFDIALAEAAAGRPQALSWENLLAGPVAKLAGPDRVVLIQARLDYGAVQPGGAATLAVRQAAAGLEFIRSGEARMALTGEVPLADEEFSSAAQGALTGLLISFVLVLLWLYLALGSWRLIVPTVLTLLLGLTLTTGFAALAVGTLNLISVAFAILFVGIAVDFSIQFTVRFRDARLSEPALAAALALTAQRAGVQVLIASVATAAGFLAFVPTSFRGVAELGLIAGIGMLLAFACTLTFLPAALALFRPRADTAEIGFLWAAPVDRVLARLRWPILATSAVLFAAGAALTPGLTFDSNTLHTKSQSSEAVQTLLRLLHNPITNPFTASIQRPTIDAAGALAAPLAKLPLVDHTLRLQSFIPDDQDAKLATLQDAAGILAPTLNATPTQPPPNAAALRAAIANCLQHLAPALAKLPPNHPLARIAADLQTLARAPDDTLRRTNTALIRFLPTQLDRLRTAFTARHVTQADIPADIRRDYVRPDGSARIQVVPTLAVTESAALRQFAAQVQSVAPDAGGPAITIVATVDTIIHAFRQAALSAIVAIALILFAFLRRATDAALVLAPLLLASAMTVLVMRATGMSLNFANIIALPLLLGVGVSFNIYFVMNWRAGDPPSLTSPTTRAVVFSALTTGTAFGSLAVSAHPGTASMGRLLLISLACTLAATLGFVPALLARKASAGGTAPPQDPGTMKAATRRIPRLSPLRFR